MVRPPTGVPGRCRRHQRLGIADEDPATVARGPPRSGAHEKRADRGRWWLMSRAVQFDSYGGIDVLELRDLPRPIPEVGEVLVEVKAAGINISEAVLRS